MAQIVNNLTKYQHNTIHWWQVIQWARIYCKNGFHFFKSRLGKRALW